MNNKLNCLIVIVGLCFSCWICTATPADCQPKTATDGWELHSDGVALKVELLTNQEGGQHHQIVQISLRNTTDHTIYLDTPGGQILAYYIDNSGHESPLYNYNQEVFFNAASPGIGPGKTYSIKWELPSDKLDILLTHSFYIMFTIWDPNAKQKQIIKSALIVLK